MMTLCLASGQNPLTHVVDHVWATTPGGLTILSNHMILVAVAGVLLITLMPRLVRVPSGGDDIQPLAPHGVTNAIDAICQFLRDYVAKPNMGPHTDRFMPYLWSVFFFVLTCNVMGLLPLEPLTRPIAGLFGGQHGVYGTPTGNIWVTGTLAVCTLGAIVINGLRLHGMTYVKHFFMGPFPVNCLIAVLEVIGLVAKSSALAVRLFANMMSGHILLAVLVGFAGTAAGASLWIGAAVAVPVVLAGAAFTLLELFVSILQAFIFTLLSAVFIGQAVNLHHDEEELEPVGIEGSRVRDLPASDAELS